MRPVRAPSRSRRGTSIRASDGAAGSSAVRFSCLQSRRIHVPDEVLGFLQEGTLASETISFAQIATASTPRGAVLYGLTSDGAVFEYNFSREVWVPVPMRALPGNESHENVVGLRGPAGSRME